MRTVQPGPPNRKRPSPNYRQPTRQGATWHGAPAPGAVPILGVDIGGVIVDRVAEDSDTSFFGSRPMETPAVDGVLEALAFLCAEVFDHRVHIVSKAGPKIAELSCQWLEQHGAFDRIGIPTSNLWFVRRRPDKAHVCTKLGITHFVDDRLDVLEALNSVPHRFLFVGGLGRHPVPTPSTRKIDRAEDWPELARRIERTVRWMKT